MGFMQHQVYKGLYFSVNTTSGTEIVPADVVGRTCSMHVEALLNYLSGKPDDPDELVEIKEGWLARLRAPGFADRTEWSAYPTEAEAHAWLDEFYGEDDPIPEEH